MPFDAKRVPDWAGTPYPFTPSLKLTLAPISLGDLERLEPQVFEEDRVTLKLPPPRATVLDMAHASLRRNYSDITRDEVAQLVDVGNMYEIFRLTLNISGFKPRKGDTPGEAPGPSAGA